jgi:chromosome segregation ATPase
MRGFTLLTLAAATLLQLKQDAKFLDSAAKEYPVTKVVNLLKDMQNTLQEEMKTDQEVYDKLACWCETNSKDKNAAVDTAGVRIKQYRTTIEEMTAKSGRVGAEIKGLESDLEASKQALAKATGIREKELAEFNAEEKDMMQSIQAMKNAVMVLGKHQDGAFVSIATVLRRHKAQMTPEQQKTVTAFIQQPVAAQSYNSQSGEIFGVINSMKDTFETNLAIAQKDELAAQDTFQQLKTAKEAEIAATSKSLGLKTVELAETDEKGAQGKENLADTTDALTADEAFLLDLKEKCAVTDKEMAARTKARQDEISAVGEAIAILTDDEARDTFSKSLGFVQVNAVLNVEKRARKQAVKILKATAAKTGNAALLGLAASAQLDVFAKVIEEIDGMIADIKTQMADDVQKKDYCTAEFAQNDKDTYKAKNEKTDLEAHIDDLTSTIETLTRDIATKQAEIAEMQIQVKRASEDREAENKVFQQTVADQRATQAILQKALTRLNDVYGFVQSKAKAQTKQEPGAAAPAAPADLSEYKQNQGAGGVLAMIQMVIDDAKKMEDEAIEAENQTQANYEAFVKNTNRSISAAQRAITNMTESKAKAEESLETAQADLKAKLTELEQLAAYAADLHLECDFTLQNFDTRQGQMYDEIEGLQNAKQSLSGANLDGIPGLGF